eukprot:IDg7687t1
MQVTMQTRANYQPGFERAHRRVMALPKLFALLTVFQPGYRELIPASERPQPDNPAHAKRNSISCTDMILQQKRANPCLRSCPMGESTCMARLCCSNYASSLPSPGLYRPATNTTDVSDNAASVHARPAEMRSISGKLGSAKRNACGSRVISDSCASNAAITFSQRVAALYPLPHVSPALHQERESAPARRSTCPALRHSPTGGATRMLHAGGAFHADFLARNTYTAASRHTPSVPVPVPVLQP